MTAHKTRGRDPGLGRASADKVLAIGVRARIPVEFGGWCDGSKVG
jgi:hypothetical protein